MNMGTEDGWDERYEWRAITLLSLGFGLVALDRFLILPMFPVIMRDLHLQYGDLGNITAALAFTWGAAAFFTGRLSDRVGRRLVLVTAMLTFSLLVGLSGLAAGVASLILIRALMGLAEGAYVPPSLAATLEASRPRRHGLNIGLQQLAAPLFGLGLAPIMVTQLMQYVDWRWIFLVVAAPGAIVAWLLQRTLREPRAAASRDLPAARLSDLLRYRNFSLAAAGMACGLSCLTVLSAFVPSYLTDHLGLPQGQMGYVTSALGFGAVIGTVVIPALSDRIGRRPAALLAAFGGTGALVMIAREGPDPVRLFLWLLVAAVFLYALVVLIVGPIAMEAVPVRLRASASGSIIAVGELFGGGVAPAAAGYVAHHYGIERIFLLAIGSAVLAFLVCLALAESAPALINRARDDHSRGIPARRPSP
jgi:MFS family permease